MLLFLVFCAQNNTALKAAAENVSTICPACQITRRRACPSMQAVWGFVFLSVWTSASRRQRLAGDAAFL